MCHFIRGYNTILIQEGHGWEATLYFDLITRDRKEYAIATSCFRLVVCLSMVKFAIEPSGPTGRSLSWFCSMKRLGVFLLPPGWDASPSQGYPQQVPIYTPVWRVACEQASRSRINQTVGACRRFAPTDKFATLL